MTLDSRLNWDKLIDRARTKAKRTLNIMDDSENYNYEDNERATRPTAVHFSMPWIRKRTQ